MRGPHRKSGFTLIELAFTVALAAVVLVQVTYVLDQVSESAQEDTAEVVLEDQIQEVLDRIAYAIMGSDRETLDPETEDLHHTRLDYKVSLGLDLASGDIVWDDPQRIALETVEDEVVWKENPDVETERRVVWGRYVDEFLAGEVFNGVDDNGNGLVDEEGLNFVIEDNSVTVRLSLRRTNSEGVPIVVTRQRLVTCRNRTAVSKTTVIEGEAMTATSPSMVSP